MCDEIIESYDKKIKATNFLQQILMKKKNVTCKTQNLCILLPFY